MKHHLITCLALSSCLSHAQTESIELIDEYLSNDENQSVVQIHKKEELLEKSLPAMMRDRILRRGQAFRAKTKALKNGAQNQFGKAKPELNLSMRLFESDAPSNILINTITQSENRMIMFGVIKDVPDSKIRLVEYQDSLTGLVSYGTEEKVVVLHSDGEGITATYEVDTTGLEFD